MSVYTIKVICELPLTKETFKTPTKERQVMDHGAGNMEGVIEKRQELTFKKGKNFLMINFQINFSLILYSTPASSNIIKCNLYLTGCKDAFPWSYKCSKPCLWWKNKGRCRHKWRKYKGCAPKASASVFVRDTCAVSCGKCSKLARKNQVVILMYCK